jgi:hypothetical protein
MNPRLAGVLGIALLAACGRGGGSPTCGIAMIAGPGLIKEHLTNARAVITDVPRGLPDSLPAIVIQQRPGAVITGLDAEQRISMQYRGPGFPPQGFGLLVVDDTSQRAMGVLIFEQQEPQQYPRIGTIIGGSTVLNLFGVRVDWVSVSNPRCPLFGPPAAPGTTATS